MQEYLYIYTYRYASICVNIYMYNVHIYVQRVSKSQIYFYTGYMTVSSWKMPCSFKKRGCQRRHFISDLVLQETYEAGIVATFHKSRSLPGSYCLPGAPSHDHWVWKSTGVVGQINFACATYPLRIFDASNNCNKTQTNQCDLVLV